MNANQFITWNLRKIALIKKMSKIDEELLGVYKKILLKRSKEYTKDYIELIKESAKIINKRMMELYEEHPFLKEIKEDIPPEKTYINNQYILLAHILDNFKETSIERAIKEAKEDLKGFFRIPLCCSLPSNFEYPPANFDFYLLTSYLIQKEYEFNTKDAENQYKSIKKLIDSIDINKLDAQKIQSIRRFRSYWDEITHRENKNAQ